VADDPRSAYKRRFERELEPERYEVCELLEELAPDRRRFLETLGSGILYLVSVRAQDQVLPARIQIADNGHVRAFTGKMEMGQGSRTLLAQAVAEELRVPVERVSLVMGDTALCPDDGGTWASLTTPQTVPVLRAAAAAVRAKRTAGGEALTLPRDWKALGQSAPKAGGTDVVTGRLRYPSDLKREGMLHAVVVRNPAVHGALVNFDGEAASRLPGVKVVREGNLLAALSTDARTAREAARLIRAEWKSEPLPAIGEWAARFRQTAVEPVEDKDARYPPLLRQGDSAAGLAAGAKRLRSEYWVTPIAHVPMEPRAALAEWRDGVMTVDCGVQAPFLVRQEVAKALGLPERSVRIVVHDSGGGFGGKQRGECEVEAALLARSAGAAVKLQWSREEEFTCSYSRPAGLLEVESAVDGAGKFTGMRFANYNAGAAGIRPQYEIPQHWVGFYRTKWFIRQGSYRSLAAVANNFARETHMEEWAAELKMDPLEFRLRNITDVRLREVLERTAERFGWGKSRQGNGRGFGLSCNLEKDARLALFVELEAAATGPRVVRMVATGDFGAALNPDNLLNQMTGALIQGMGGALWEQLLFDGEKQRTRRLSQYRVPRFRDLPAMDVRLVDRREVEPAGAGESPITLTAPAIGAALFAATGVRHRRLPMTPASIGG
jgi:isoquinoline 1-oxidoreductase